ncbi:MAG TPA: flagellar basal body-associated FliL family protein [Bdellovibrionota bacterium]|nr:flagellar basal body-associated FliL family protein [Bdellovibrionota bacterium]
MAASEPNDASAALKELESELSTSTSAPAKAGAPVRKKRDGAKRGAAAAAARPTRVTFGQRVRALREKFADLARSLASEDRPTRRMSALFFVSVAGMALVLGVACERYWRHVRELRAHADRIARRENAVLEEFLRKRSEIVRRKNSMLTLGEFTVELRGEEGGRRPASMRLAEIELVIECDSKESRDFLEEHMTRAQNEVTNTFVNIAREEFMTPEGKNRLKRELRNRLNSIMPSGKIENVYFSKLVLS